MVLDRWLNLLQGVRVLWAAVLAANLFVFGLVAHDIQQAQKDYRNGVERDLLHLSQVWQDGLSGFLVRVDLCLESFQADFSQGQAGVLPSALDSLLSRRLSQLPGVVGLQVVDARGVVSHAAGRGASPGDDLAGEEGFRKARTDASGSLVMQDADLANGEASLLLLSRRLTDSQGRFAGQIRATVDVANLSNTVSALGLGPGTSAILSGSRGQVLMHLPEGRPVRPGVVEWLATQMESGAVETSREFAENGSSRLYHFRRLPELSLGLVLGVSEEAWSAPWRREVTQIGGLAGVFLIFTLLGAWAVHQGVRARNAAVDKLESTRHDLQAILDNVPALIGYWDADLKNRFGNHVYEDWFGLAPDDLRGRFMPEVLGDEHFRQILPHVQAALRGEAQRFERTVIKPNGPEVSVLVNFIPDRRDGGVRGFYAMVTDISAMKQVQRELQRESERNRMLLRAASDGIHVLDTKGRLLEANDAFCDMLGYGRDELLGATVADWDVRWTPAQWSDMLRALFSGRTVFETRHRRKDGRVLEVEISSIGVELQGEQLLYCSARDISERKATQQSLEGHKERLEELVAARTVELEASREEAERMARVKGEFLANMSHEIRTPLNAILGLSRMGLKESIGRRSEDTFRRIQDAGGHLLGLVDDILDYSRMESGRMALDLRELPLAEILDRAVDLVSGKAYAKKLRLRLEEAPDLPCCVKADGLRITQVLVNLLSNAVKFTDPGGSVSLFAGRDGKGVLLAVSDTGIGMAPEQVKRLYAPFEQEDGSARRHYGGAGLGLAICRRLIDLMGGRIEVDSARDVGSTFRVRLPLEECESGGAPEKRPEADRGEVLLCGLDAKEAEELGSDLAARGIAWRILHPGDAPPETAALLVADSVGIRECRARAGQTPQTWPATVRVYTPDEEGLETGGPDEQFRLLRPLRARQVMALLAATGEASGASASPPGQRLAGVRILAAEDNEVNRLVLEDMVRGEGAQFTCVENGRQLVDWLRREGTDAWDVILTDVQMPEMDGLEATRQIRSMPRPLPVLGITAHTLPEERLRCFEAGMVEHIAKPVDLEILVAAILKHLGHPSAQPGLAESADSLEARPEEREAAAEPAVPAVTAAVPESPQAPATDAGEVSEGVEPITDTGAIDWNALDVRYRGKATFIAKVLRMAVGGNARVAGELREAARARDLPVVARLSHNLKSLGGNLSAPAFLELAVAADTAAKANAPEVFDLGERLADALDRLLETAARGLETYEGRAG